MSVQEEIKQKLMCPVHRLPLTWKENGLSGEDLNGSGGWILCEQGCRFEIQNGIPRFVPRDNYAKAFGAQWQRYREVQLDSYTGQPHSRQRLERCLGTPLDALKGKTLLECGAGAGRFTELLINHCENLVSIDISDAVEANFHNCSSKGSYLLFQADINTSPLPYRYFDYVICLGVIQHTPSPEQTIACLANHVKPGGWLVFDHYTHRSRWSAVGSYLSSAVPLRTILKRVSRKRPDIALKVTMMITSVCDPIRKRTSRLRWLDSFASRIFPSACYYQNYPMLPPHIIYKWNELDTHDRLTDWFKHFRTQEDIYNCLCRLGFEHISSVYSGNGVEARGRYLGSSSSDLC